MTNSDTAACITRNSEFPREFYGEYKALLPLFYYCHYHHPPFLLLQSSKQKFRERNARVLRVDSSFFSSLKGQLSKNHCKKSP